MTNSVLSNSKPASVLHAWRHFPSMFSLALNQSFGNIARAVSNELFTLHNNSLINICPTDCRSHVLILTDNDHFVMIPEK